MKKNLTLLFLLLNVFSLSFFSLANAQAEEGVIVTADHVRESIPGTRISSAYMTIANNHSENIKLISATSELSPRIEIHQHMMENGMMKMRKQAFLVVQANNRVVLQPSGYHLMIFDLKTPLTDGEIMAITLYFDNQTEVTVSLPIQGLKKKNSHHHHH